MSQILAQLRTRPEDDTLVRTLTGKGLEETVKAHKPSFLQALRLDPDNPVYFKPTDAKGVLKSTLTLEFLGSGTPPFTAEFAIAVDRERIVYTTPGLQPVSFKLRPIEGSSK